MQILKTDDNSFNNPFFIGEVVDNNDPKCSYRVKVKIEGLHKGIPNDKLPWAAKVDSSFLGVKDETAYAHSVPLVGSKVLVLAIANDPNSLVYLGCIYKNVEGLTPSGDEYLQNWGIYGKDNQFVGLDKINKCFKMLMNGDIDIEINQAKNVTVKVKENITVECTNAEVKVKESAKVECKNSELQASNNVKVTCKTANVNASNINIDAATTNIKGNVNITGNTTMTGSLTATGKVGFTAYASGIIKDTSLGYGGSLTAVNGVVTVISRI